MLELQPAHEVGELTSYNEVATSKNITAQRVCERERRGATINLKSNKFNSRVHFAEHFISKIHTYS